MIEDGIAQGRRAFPKAQELLGGAVSRRLPGFVEVGWHGTARSLESGSFALVGLGSELSELVGDIVKVTGPSGFSVFAYVLGVRDVATELSLTRRTFLGMELLSKAPVGCVVEVV